MVIFFFEKTMKTYLKAVILSLEIEKNLKTNKIQFVTPHFPPPVLPN